MLFFRVTNLWSNVESVLQNKGAKARLGQPVVLKPPAGNEAASSLVQTRLENCLIVNLTLLSLQPMVAGIKK